MVSDSASLSSPNYLQPTEFIDSGEKVIAELASSVTAGLADERSRAVEIYKAVRDGVIYDVYIDYSDPSNFRASGVLAQGRGFCVGKAAVLAACCRAAGIPARVGYADVRNHMTSRRLYEMMRTDVFTWHSYTDICVGGRWVRATPAFDAALCLRLGLTPLEFDGASDSLFSPSIQKGGSGWSICTFGGTLPTSHSTPSWPIFASDTRDCLVLISEMRLPISFVDEIGATCAPHGRLLT